ncbi:hypothetical protein GJV76_11845 [Myroides sp. BIT-d1]|uniref:Uncharacterized protein n=1 Tax=Myroides albus TaxID=2562892 RepID=A0A6I3LLS9_9FLAO|nr:hypothetical protein [Myroides albus]MTG98814.1 hypothetical protein [Myroides albus]
MKNYLGILSSDLINKDRIKFTFGALEDMISTNAIQGIPSLINHDKHRPIGWIFPLGLYIEPKITKAIGNFYNAEVEDDLLFFDTKINEYWKNYHLKECKEFISDFKVLLGDYFSKDGIFLKKSCVAYHSLNIVKQIFPELFSNLDKSGLIYLEEILVDFDYIGSGIFKNKKNDFCIYCHQFFNRNLSMYNNYNTYFIDEFVRLSKKKEITLRIAIDPNLIGLSKTFKGTFEFDYWWGPKFDNNISKLPNGVTRYECNEDFKFFSGVSGTEFWWKSDKDEKILEIEEIKENPSLGIDKNSYGCRYIHSIYNTNKEEFIHFDGAIRLYTEEAILERWDTSISKIGKNTEYTKIFRIDGRLGLDDWKKLSILYYNGNPLLYEYFGVKDNFDKIVESNNENNDIINKYLPAYIREEDGIRLFISYHKKQQDYDTFDRKAIHPFNLKFGDNKTIECFEYDILEIAKIIKRNGGNLDYSKNIKFIKPYDFLTNYPIIIHGSNNTSELIKDTFNAFKLVFTEQNKTLNKTISLSIGWEMENFEVRLSVMGKSSEILKWMKSNSEIPTIYIDFKRWALLQQEWIYNNYAYQKKDYLHLLSNDGVFYLNRIQIQNEIINFQHFKNVDPSSHRLKEIEDIQLRDLVQKGELTSSYMGLLNTVLCTKTGTDYIESSTSKYLDDGVSMAISDIELLYFFWSQKEE